MVIPCTHLLAVIDYANATLPPVVTAFQFCRIWLLTTCHLVTNLRLEFASHDPRITAYIYDF